MSTSMSGRYDALNERFNEYIQCGMSESQIKARRGKALRMESRSWIKMLTDAGYVRRTDNAPRKTSLLESMYGVSECNSEYVWIAESEHNNNNDNNKQLTTLTVTEADLIFVETKNKSQRTLDFQEFNQALVKVSEKVDYRLEEMISKIIRTHPSRNNVTQTEDVRFAKPESFTGVFKHSNGRAPTRSGDGSLKLEDILDRSPSDVRGLRVRRRASWMDRDRVKLHVNQLDSHDNHIGNNNMEQHTSNNNNKDGINNNNNPSPMSIISHHSSSIMKSPSNRDDTMSSMINSDLDMTWVDDLKSFIRDYTSSGDILELKTSLCRLISEMPGKVDLDKYERKAILDAIGCSDPEQSTEQHNNNHGSNTPITCSITDFL